VFLLSKFFIAPNILKQGEIRAKTQSDLYRLLGRTFGNFKLNKTSNNQYKLSSSMSKILEVYTRSQVNFLTLAEIPRYLIETLGFGIIVAIVIYLYFSNDGNITDSIPILVLFAVSLFRILPSYNRIISGVNNIYFFRSALDIVLDEMSSISESLGNDQLAFHRSIECKEITFFHGKHKVLEDISFTINKGESIAIIGGSGSGKTTLVDIIMGITSPEKGNVIIDGIKLTNKNKESWRRKIGYVPQDIYLMDGTIRDNVLFDRDYDDTDLISAIRLANMSKVITSKNGLETRVGDSGIQLSGGQKQRVGIARATLGNPDILIFDEGTSALDEITEKAILSDLLANNKDKTILFITHKKGLIDQFDKIISL